MRRSSPFTTRQLLSALCAGTVAMTLATSADAQIKLLPPDGQPNSVYFGDSGAISGDRVIVGASNIAAAEGAYIYENVGGTWTLAASLNPGTDANWDYGWSVGIDGDHAAVGAYRSDVGGAGFQNGAVFVYHRDAGGTGNWGETQVLSPSNLVPSEQFWFGHSLGLDGNTLAVGAPRANDTPVADRGFGYIFEYNGTNWVEAAIREADPATTTAQFGYDTAVSGDNVIFGAPRDVHLPSGGSDGAAYIFNRNAGGEGNWGRVQKLTASDHLPGDAFGMSVDISGNTAVVAAPWTDELEVEGNPNSRSGSVYIYDFNGTEWVETAQVHSSDPQIPHASAGSDGYGYGPGGVATNGDILVVASTRHQPAEGSVNDGAIFIYSRNAGGLNAWGEIAAIYGELNVLDNWGSVVDIDGQNFLVGARFDDDGGTNVGAAYIIPIPEPTTAMLLASAGAGLLLRRRSA